VYVLDGEEKLTKIITIDQTDLLLSILNFLFCTFCIYTLSRMFTDNGLGEFEYVAEKLARVLFGRILPGDDEKQVAELDNIDETKINKLTKEKLDKKILKIKKLMKLFKDYFLLFWIILSILYACLIIKSISNLHTSRDKLVSEKTIGFLEGLIPVRAGDNLVK
jgi:hypothetical protein